MSLTAPTRKVEYQLGQTWIDISDDVLDFDIRLRDLAAGMSEFDLTLDNKEGKHSKSAGTFPAFGIEQGLYYRTRFQVNNAYLLVGRMTKPEPVLEDNKDTFKIHGRCLGQELNNLLIADQWIDEKADDIIADVLTKAGATDVAYSSPSTAPKITIDAMQNPRYLYDIIREICEQVDYAAFVKTQAAVTQGTLLFFPKADSGRRHSTVLKNVLYANDNNVKAFNMPRSIDEIKNWALFIGRLSSYEPSDMDAWTEEGTDGWTSRNAVTSVVRDGRYAPVPGATSHYSILGMSDSKTGPWFRLSLPTVLGEDLNCIARSADFLHFWYAVKPGLDFGGPSICAVSPKVFLQDYDGNRIFHPLDQIAGIDSDWWSTWIWFRTNGGWKEVSIPVGSSAQMSIYIEGEPGHPSRTIQGDWSFDKGYSTFNWDKVSFIEFQDDQDHQLFGAACKQKNYLWIDGLYFHQAFTPVYVAKDQISRGKYGLHMEMPATVDFSSLKQLKDWGDKVILAMSQPTLMLDVDALLDPAAETLYPAYSISANIPRIYVTPGSPYFRILEVHHRWSPPASFITHLSLIPSTAA